MFRRRAPIPSSDNHNASRRATLEDDSPEVTAFSTGFSLNNSDGYGVAASQFSPVLGIGLGSTGSKLLLKLRELLLLEFGAVPDGFEFLMIDSAPSDDSMLAEHFVQLPESHDGAGSDPNEGRKMMLDAYPAVRNVLRTMLQRLSATDPRVPCERSPELLVTFLIFGSCGGTSGGALEVAITLCHDLALEHRIGTPRVELVLIGANMARNDRSRSMSSQQSVVIPDTMANNLNALFADMRNPARAEFECPGRSPLSLRLSERVWSISLYDDSNGEFHFDTTPDLLQMIAHNSLFGTFTRISSELAARICDQVGLNETGQRFDS